MVFLTFWVILQIISHNFLNFLYLKTARRCIRIFIFLLAFKMLFIYLMPGIDQLKNPNPNTQ